ncbi:putative PNPOx domain-containing protein [Mycena chlorophos]|uniref:Putative PNPOx domain-containing protein n=1 Tax=Mycena chlorophos TaxID=658473 RepID=A0A8H6SV15_MYCCL|nr:putative PNPOx domain-containing protein [Mycena chlorophos]
MALNGWHRGEDAIHLKLGTYGDYAVDQMYRHVDGELPEEHAEFHSTRLSFLPVTTLDSEGRPWGSVLAAKGGKRGFVRATRYSTLSVDAELWDGDPLLENAEMFGKTKEMLVAGIGVELSTRRRNKFAGTISSLERNGTSMSLDFVVNEAIGNCPKYITIRDLQPVAFTAPRVIHRNLQLTAEARLPEEVLRMISKADTVFLGTTYQAMSKDSMRFPSHVGMNYRGGRAGFIRVTGDGRTIVLPDYSGNRIMTSLGNIEATPLASLTFIDFVTGDILYLTGNADNLALTTIYVTGYTLVRDALPVRQHGDVESSPYSPPIRLLATESSQQVFGNDSATQPTALLTSIELHSSTIATFTWRSSTQLQIRPGQAIIMDMSPLVGIPAYRHMAPGKPTSVNDDSVRSWTVSSVYGRAVPSPSTPSHARPTDTCSTTEYSVTLREKRGGAVTGPLFTIARKLQQVRPEALEDSSGLGLKVGIVGVSGDFVLPEREREPGIADAELGLQIQLESARVRPEPKKLLWIAGGIGLTPFLSMLRALRGTDEDWDVLFVLATREPEVLVPLVEEALGDNPRVALALDVFTRETGYASGKTATVHHQRLPADFFVGIPDVLDREAYLCGSPEFEKVAMSALTASGVGEGSVKREGFAY